MTTNLGIVADIKSVCDVTNEIWHQIQTLMPEIDRPATTSVCGRISMVWDNGKHNISIDVPNKFYAEFFHRIRSAYKTDEYTYFNFDATKPVPRVVFQVLELYKEDN